MSNLLDRLMTAIRGAINTEIAGVDATESAAPAPDAPPTMRALTLDIIYNEVCEQGREMFPSGTYLTQIYLGDDGTLYALWGRETQLYRTPILVENGMITMGEQEEVRQEFTPVTRSRVVLRELDNGDVRFFLVAATAVVNRVGEIDSTALFDNMVKRAEELQFYPRLDAYHLGSLDPAFEFGQFDFLAREGVAYLASGVMDGKHPLTRAILKLYRTNPDALGASIEYYALEDAFEDVEVGGLTIRTYLDGVNTRISIVLESDAASWFTSMLTGAGNMQKRTLDDATKARLIKLFGDDEEALNGFLDGVGGIGRAVDELGLIHRDKKAAPGGGGPGGAETAAEAGQDGGETVVSGLEATAEVELDDDTLGLIADEVVNRLGDQHLKTVNGQIAELTAAVKKLTTNTAEVLRLNEDLAGRVELLEADDEAKQREWVADLSPRQKISVTHRPRVERQTTTEPEKPKTFADLAEETLAALPDPFGKR